MTPPVVAPCVLGQIDADQIRKNAVTVYVVRNGYTLIGASAVGLQEACEHSDVTKLNTAELRSLVELRENCAPIEGLGGTQGAGVWNLNASRRVAILESDLHDLLNALETRPRPAVVEVSEAMVERAAKALAHQMSLDPTNRNEDGEPTWPEFDDMGNAWRAVTLKQAQIILTAALGATGPEGVK